MSSRDEYRQESPSFEQPDGVSSFGEERTVPLGDVHPATDPSSGASPYGAPAGTEHTLPTVDPHQASAASEHTLPLDPYRAPEAEPTIPLDAYRAPGAAEPTIPLGDLSGRSSAPEQTPPLPAPVGASAAPDHTLPLVDLYPTSENWAGASPYASSDDYAPAGYTPVQHAGGPPPAVVQQPQYQAQQQYLAQQPPYQEQQFEHQWGQQPPYQGQWVQQQNPYMQQPGPYQVVPAEHPNATTVVVLGAVSVGVPVLSFVAWYMGSKAKGEIARGAPYAYAGNLKTGHILGKVIGILTIVGASLYGLFLLFYLIMMIGLLSM